MGEILGEEAKKEWEVIKEKVDLTEEKIKKNLKVVRYKAAIQVEKKAQQVKNQLKE